jgi:hypothetical protein
MLGQKESDLKKCDKGIDRLNKAVQLCYKQKLTKPVIDLIELQITKARKIRFYINQTIEDTDKATLLS